MSNMLSLTGVALVVCCLAPCWCLYTVPVGVILVNATVLPFSYEALAPAIDMAVERMRHDVGINLDRYYGVYPGMCDPSTDVGKVADLHDQSHVQAFIGPTCSEGVSAAVKLATYYDCPLVTGVGELVQDIAKYPIFTRLSYSIERQSCKLTCFISPWGIFY